MTTDVSTTLFSKVSSSSTSSSSSVAAHTIEPKMASDLKNFKGKSFYFFVLVKLTLVFACFAMFFLLMSDVFDKYRNKFSNTAVRCVPVAEISPYISALCN